MSKNTSSDPSTHTHQKKSPFIPQPVPPPTAQELGTLTAHLESVLAGGPHALKAATRKALKASAKHNEPFEAEWFLLTDYLKSILNSTSASTRARAHHALRWRPKFLAALAVTGSQNAACRHAECFGDLIRSHRKVDKTFDAQVEAARTYFVELLHDRVKQRALEGDCEPVFYMGVPCGWVRKFDSRLQIEVLRAHLPQTYKTPGDKPITINTTNNVLVLDPESRHAIQEARSQALRAQRARLQEALPSAGTSSP